MVDVGSAEAAIQDACHCRFGVAGIGTGVLPGVFSNEAENTFSVAG